MKVIPNIRLLCSAPLAGCSLKVGRAKVDGALWLINETTAAEELTAKEIFGFNIGSFSEVLSGLFHNRQKGSTPNMFQPQKFSNMFSTPKVFKHVQPQICFQPQKFSNMFSLVNDSTLRMIGDTASLTDQIPWSITSDLETICLVTTDSAGVTSKRLMSVCEAVCELTRTRGATECAMIDYSMAPMTKAWIPKPKNTVI